MGILPLWASGAATGPHTLPPFSRATSTTPECLIIAQLKNGVSSPGGARSQALGQILGVHTYFLFLSLLICLYAMAMVADPFPNQPSNLTY